MLKRSRKSRFASGVRRVVGATLGTLLGTYVVAMNTAPQITPPARPPVPAPNQNGFLMLKAATAKIFHDDDVKDAVKSKPEKKRSLVEKQTLIDDNRIPIEQTRKALLYSYSEETTSNTLYEKMPYYDRFRQMTRVLTLAGNVAWEKGKQKEATDYYLDGVTIGRRIPHHVGLVGSLVGMASESIARRPLWEHLDQMSEKTASGALARLQQLTHERMPYSETLEQDKYIMLTGIKTAMEHPEKFSELVGGGTSGDRLMRVYFRVAPRKYVIDTMGAQMDRVIAQTKKPYILDHKELPLPAEIITRMMMPVLTVARCKHVANETGDNLLRTALSLRIYRLQNGKYPERLSDLVDAKIMVQVPEDPFALPGQSLQYERQADGNYLLYSVGPDGIDNSGKGIDNNHPSNSTNRAASMDSKGDMVAGWYSY